mmetsp:Transcript_41506/g.96034  ORF Transcript_41506/g.96034 Transcript_41506/m.96034 type:complete len:83 (-) Transcript_41506:8-256(-)
MSVGVSPCGNLLVTCSGSQITLWDARSGAKLRVLNSGGEPSSPSSPKLSHCSVAIGAGRILDPSGFGLGVSYAEMRRTPRHG